MPATAANTPSLAIAATAPGSPAAVAAAAAIPSQILFTKFWITNTVPTARTLAGPGMAPFEVLSIAGILEDMVCPRERE